MHPTSLTRLGVAGVLVMAIVMVMSAVAVGGKSAKPTPYFACVSESTGLMRLVDPGIACNGDERRIKWNAEGPKGDTGARGARGKPGPIGPAGSTSNSTSNGSMLNVKDATGKVLGGFMGMGVAGRQPTFLVLVDGKVIAYDNHGALGIAPGVIVTRPTNNYNGNPLYASSGCTGTAYDFVPAEATVNLPMAGGYGYMTAYYTGRVRAVYAYTGTTSPVTDVADGTYYFQNNDGTCTQLTSWGGVQPGVVHALDSLPFPATGIGPLSVG